MNRLIFAVPNDAIPVNGSSAFELLKILSDGKKHPRDSLCQSLGGGFRGYLQQLTGSKYQYWLIHCSKGTFNERRQAFYWLDSRHFLSDWEIDKDARVIARKKYKDRSYGNSEKAVSRLENARAEKEEADLEFQMRISSRSSP